MGTAVRLRFVLIFCCVFVPFCTLRAADMHNLQKSIKATRSNITRTNTKLQALNATLHKQEKQLSAVQQNIISNKKAISAKRSKIQSLLISKSSKQNKLKKQQQSLKSDLSATYKLLNQPLLKRMLSDVDAQPRLLHYHKMLLLVQLDKVQALQNLLDQIKQNQDQLTYEQGQLQQNKIVLQSKLQQQKGIMQQRSRTVRKLQKSLAKSSQKLQQYLAERNALEKTIAKIKSKPKGKNRFKKLQGNLAWPVQGRVAHSYGSKVAQTALRYKGVVIDAPVGEPVRAVAGGTVLFAEWMVGYGQLIIIDHGDGYLSLYGRNQRLNVRVNEHVKKGSIIAWVGMSGGFTKSSLYFALRRRDTPLNPKKWLRRNMA